MSAPAPAGPVCAPVCTRLACMQVQVCLCYCTDARACMLLHLPYLGAPHPAQRRRSRPSEAARSRSCPFELGPPLLLQPHHPVRTHAHQHVCLRGYKRRMRVGICRGILCTQWHTPGVQGGMHIACTGALRYHCTHHGCLSTAQAPVLSDSRICQRGLMAGKRVRHCFLERHAALGRRHCSWSPWSCNAPPAAAAAAATAAATTTATVLISPPFQTHKIEVCIIPYRHGLRPLGCPGLDTQGIACLINLIRQLQTSQKPTSAAHFFCIH